LGDFYFRNEWPYCYNDPLGGNVIGKFRTLFNDREYFDEIFRIAGPIAIQQLAFRWFKPTWCCICRPEGGNVYCRRRLAGQVAFLLNLVHFGIVSGAAMFTAQFWWGKKTY